MQNTTGLFRDEIEELCARIEQSTPEVTWPPVLGLFTSVVVTLTYLRRNRVQAEIAEAVGVSQPTISRAITTITPLIEAVLGEVVPTADDLDTDHAQYIVDGTLVPCWTWTGHQELYSGKHHTTGMNLQIVATTTGTLCWISDPQPGSRHDVTCLDNSGALTGTDPTHWIGDKGYVGRGMTTPIKKPAHRDLLDWEKTYNKTINATRAIIEQVIAHFKNWRIMHTDYRRPLHTFPQTISTVIALHFWATA